MIRDPLFRAINQRLDDGVDPDAFELFAAEVVRKEIASAVPLRGGGDSGADGLAAVSDGPPIPIVVTTSNDAIGNLSRNLSRYASEWPDPSKRAVFVTHRSLTPRRQQNLIDRAKSLGFRLVQVYEREAVARRLYELPVWRRELLGLTGNPPALSQVPERYGAWAIMDLVARDEDLTWLSETTGDKLIHGVPACGKTFLLEQYARQNDAFFATIDDVGRLADDVREFSPAAVIVDDAHVRTGRLEAVKQVRDSTGASFSIVAAAWTGSEGSIAEVLNLRSSSIRALSLLRRDQIADVLTAMGLEGPDWVVGHLLDQADGRVGLAVTLAARWIAGDHRDVVSGDALIRFVESRLDPGGEHSTLTVLAAFGVGGPNGLPVGDVVSALGVDYLSLMSEAARIGSSGFIIPRREGDSCERLAVEPEVLRGAAAREVFFGPGPRLPLQLLQSLDLSPDALGDVLTEVVRQGGEVEDGFLREVLTGCTESSSLIRYAYLGADQASWALGRRPDLLTAHSTPFLNNLPEQSLEALLDVAMRDSEVGLRIVEKWIQSGYPGTGVPVVRRKILHRMAIEWSEVDLSRQAIAESAIYMAIDPTFSDDSVNPIDDRQFRIRSGVATENELLEILRLWPPTVEWLRSGGRVDWLGLLEHLERWVQLGGSRGVDDDTEAAVMPLVQRMLADSARLSRGHPAVLRMISELALIRGWSTFEGVDAVFQALYPEHDARYDEEALETLALPARALAESWAGEDPEGPIQELARCRQERDLVDHMWPDFFGLVLCEIARRVGEPLDWLSRIVASPLPPGCEQPFLLESIRHECVGWESVASECLDDTDSAGQTAVSILRFSDAPNDLVERSISVVSNRLDLVKTACLRNEVATANLIRILQSDDRTLAGVSAVAHWTADPKGQVTPDVEGAWCEAIVWASADEWFIEEIFADYPDLAAGWLSARPEVGTSRTFALEYTPYPKVLRHVPIGEWPDLFEVLEPKLNPWSLVSHAIGSDVDAFRELLQEDNLSHLHLAPFESASDESPPEMISAALDAGHDAEAIVDAIVGRLHGWSGSESQHWQMRIDSLPALDNLPAAVADVVSRCSETHRRKLIAARDRELAAAVHGSR